MMIGLIVRGARAASHGGTRQPVKRQRKTYTPASARLSLACCLLVVIFVTAVMLTCPMSP
jgi:hypothetical protein